MEMQQNDLDLLLRLDKWESTFPDFTPEEVATLVYEYLINVGISNLNKKDAEWITDQIQRNEG